MIRLLSVSINTGRKTTTDQFSIFGWPVVIGTGLRSLTPGSPPFSSMNPRAEYHAGICPYRVCRVVFAKCREGRSHRRPESCGAPRGWTQVSLTRIAGRGSRDCRERQGGEEVRRAVID